MLPRDVYQQLVQCLSLPVGAYPHFDLLLKRHAGVRLATLVSIFSQENQYRVIKCHHIHKTNIPRYWERYVAGEDLLEIAANVDFPPCLLARRMLEQMLRLSKQDVTTVLKSPGALPAAAGKAFDSRPAPDARPAPEFIARLQEDLARCARADVAYSPYSDMARQIAGQEHELLLYSELQKLGIAFWSEADLRSQGLHKTPDARLQVPIAVLDPQLGTYRVVNWIDSKATFGDERTHQAQLEGQYRNYVNRYGSGLVIYWFGYLADLANDAEVLILDRCPSAQEIRLLPQLQLALGA